MASSLFIDLGGSTPGERSDVELQYLHDTARQLFKEKRERVIGYHPPLRLTLDDFLFDPTRAHLAYIPADLQLDFYFAHYKRVAENDFTAHSFKHVDVVCAIWYYNIDRKHTFSRHFENVRYNIMMMALIWGARNMGSSNFDRLCADDAGTFWYTYIRAWLEAIHSPTEFSARDTFIQYWHKSPYDLVQFRTSTRKRLVPVVRKIKAMVCSIAVPPSEFITQCENGQMTQEAFEQEGPILALQWATEQEKAGLESDETVEMGQAAKGHRSLRDVPWNSSHVTALMTPIDRAGDTMFINDRTPWADERVLEQVLEEVEMGDLERMCQRLSIVGGEQADYDMEE